MTIYGERFRQEKKEKLKLNNFDSLKSLKPDINSFPDKFPKCFTNNALVQTVKSVLLVLRNKRNVIIVGNDESGLTQIVEWCSYYFNKELLSKNLMKSSFVFTPKTWNALI